MKKVIVVGAGPAGLFASKELSDSFRVTVVEKRSSVGGAGLCVDGKLNFHPRVGGDLTEFVTEEEAWELVEKVYRSFEKFGLPGSDSFFLERQRELEVRAARAGIKFVPTKQRHIGSDVLPKVMEKFKRELEREGVDFLLSTRAINFRVKGNKVMVETDKGTLEADFLIVAPGRGGSEWLSEQAKRLGIPLKFNPVDVGVRVEVPNEVVEEIIHEYKCWDPKFHIRTESYDDFVRTFCTCPSGFVTVESYGNSLFGVNGHSMRFKKSENTNFAFLVRVGLTRPLEDTTKYGKWVVSQTNVLGGGKPVIQRLGDLKKHRRSTWERIERSYVEPTLKDVTPGDISMAYPYRIVKNLLEGLEKLGKVIPGVDSSSTLLYAPEVKFYAMRVVTNERLQTSVPRVFVAGDGAGVSRGIVGAAATGMIAAMGVKTFSER